MPRGVDLAEDRPGHRFAAEHAAVERRDERVGLLRHPAHAHRLAGHQHHAHRLSQPGQLLVQLDLPAGEREVSAILGFAHLGVHIADHIDDGVALPGQRHRLGHERLVLLAGQHAAALRVAHLRTVLRAEGLHALLHGRVRAHPRMPRIGQRMREVRPVAVLGGQVVRVRADDRDPLRRKRQHAVVAQQDQALVRHPPGEAQMRLAAEVLRVAQLVRMLEQPHAQLDGQDAAHGVVEHGLVHLAASHGADGRVVEAQRRHDQVVAGLGRQPGGLLQRLADVLLVLQALHVVPVGDDKAVKAQLVAQDAGQQLLAHGAGCAVQRAVRRHKRGAARLHRLGKRGQEHLAHLAEGDLAVHRVARAGRLAVGDIVLGAGEDAVPVGEVVALIAPDELRAQLARQIRVLAERLVDAPPAGIARQAEHGRERPVQAVGRDLPGGGAAHGIHRLAVPAARSGELRREDGRMLVQPVAVNGVDAEHRRNAQPRARADLLKMARVVAQRMQERACAAARPHLRLFLADHGAGHLNHLGSLFLKRHPGEDCLRPFPDLWIVHRHDLLRIA